MLLVKTHEHRGARHHWALFKTRELPRNRGWMLSCKQPYTLLSGNWYGDFRKATSYGKGVTTKRFKVIGRIRPRWARFWLA